MKKAVLFLLPIMLMSCQTKQVASSVASEDSFAYSMMKQSVAEGTNAFLSPTSVAMALNMLTPGAEKQTLKELQAVVPAVSIASTDFLKVASAIWINEGVQVYPAYLTANKDAEVYAGPILAQKVNGWASSKTNGKINKIVEDPIRLPMMLTNALYFKAQWQHPFKSQNTKQETFYGAKGEHKADMMHQTNHFAYIENRKMQAIRLDYTSPYCMDIILPAQGKSVADVMDEVQTLDLSAAESCKVRLTLPKVKLEYEKVLNDYLSKMGLSTCFSSKADFSRISASPLFIGIVKQNTFLAIDEEGTEAAAVTSVMMAMSARPIQEKIYEMNINRPFVLLIRETETNRILFYGVINTL